MTDDATVRSQAQAQLLSVHRELRSCTLVGELLARASTLACQYCGFSRAVILSVRGEYLTGDGSDPLADPASDLLRRAVLAAPIPLRGWNEESSLLRGDGGRERRRPATRSVVADALRLKHYALGVITPETTPIALLVVDRADGPVDDDVRADVAGFAAMTAIALEQAVLRARMRELTAELRFLSGSVLGLVGEMTDTPVTIPSHGRHGPVFASLDGPLALAGGRGAGDLLSPREHEVAQLLTKGRSNREIAQALHLSPDTVKGNVAAVLRKLNASNRAEAVAKYLAVTPPGE